MASHCRSNTAFVGHSFCGTQKRRVRHTNGELGLLKRIRRRRKDSEDPDTNDGMIDNYSGFDNEEEEEELKQLSWEEVKSSKLDRNITASASLELPFSAQVAYDKFANLEEHSNWSTWLKKVEYTDLSNNDDNDKDDDKERLRTSKWSAGMRGFTWSWDAINTELQYPTVVAWKSTSGVRNHGRVEFDATGPESAHMTIEMAIEAPRFVALFFRRSKGLSRFIEQRMLNQMIRNFRDEVVMEQQQQNQIKQ